jgi:hypothetical protein
MPSVISSERLTAASETECKRGGESESKCCMRLLRRGQRQARPATPARSACRPLQRCQRCCVVVGVAEKQCRFQLYFAFSFQEHFEKRRKGLNEKRREGSEEKSSQTAMKRFILQNSALTSPYITRSCSSVGRARD